MHYFTPVKTLPEGAIYLTDLTHVADFSDWLAEFETLLDQNRRFATVCTPMRRQVTDAAQLQFFREQSSKLAPALGVNYIVEADEQTALLRAEEALKAV